ncbi:MAG: aspartate aminotransferase family protein [Deltaproteobacteria bacterium]|nr:aspartate aminotransferase family protein [Deltaproteobacteria bacterium]
MKLEKRGIPLLEKAVQVLEEGFSELPEAENDFNFDEIASVLTETAEKLRDNYPYFHPLYAGQMLKPAHPIAHLAYMLAMWINPNNHALDGGRASSHMEKEAVAEITKMFGWESHLGHLTGGGTMANMEALWVSGMLNPGKLIVASEQAHYTHNRITQVLKLPFRSVDTDDRAKMDLNRLEDILKEGNVGTVVATMGTTATGSIDPLGEILTLREKYGFRVHADAAYGGYFVLAENLPEETKAAYQYLSEVDSVAIDPHKHGLQPYVAGCIVFRDPAVGKLYKHDSPYTYFSSKELHLGEISLECSRAGASAVALWATQRLFPLVRGGRFAKMLERCHAAALELYGKLAEDSRFIVAFPPELDIVIWAPKAESISKISALSTRQFEEAEERGLYLALATLPVKFFKNDLEGVEIDQEAVTCLRSCLMKPEHLDWVDRIYEMIVGLKM